MPRISAFGLGVQSRSRAVTAARSQNIYFEPRPVGEKAQIVAYGTPGLMLFANAGDTPWRGLVAVEPTDILYGVHRGTLYSINNAGTITSQGTLDTTTGRVSMTHNGSNVLMVDGTGGYVYSITYDTFFRIEEISTGTTTATTSGKLVDSGAAFDTDGTRAGMAVFNTTSGTSTIVTAVDSATTLSVASNIFASGNGYAVGEDSFLDGSNTATWQDQYFIVADESEFAISVDGVTWSATQRAVAESSPDGIVAVFADHGEVLILGDLTTEFWTNTGATDFPFAPLKSSTAEWGLAARWSLCKFNDSIAGLVKNRMGQVSVAKFEGYVPRIISTPDIDEIINSYATVSDATAYSYMLGGHPMYEISFPSAGYSWLYDALANHWSPRKSANITRQRNEIGVQYLNKTIVSDYDSGVLYTLRDDVYTENGEMIERELISGTVANPDLERLSIDRFRIDMETGIGLATGQGSDPQVMLQVSRDGGNSYGAEMWRSAGEIGQYRRRVEWRKLGGAEQFVFRLRMTDPVKFAAVNESVNPVD